MAPGSPCHPHCRANVGTSLDAQAWAKDYVHPQGPPIVPTTGWDQVTCVARRGRHHGQHEKDYHVQLGSVNSPLPFSCRAPSQS